MSQVQVEMKISDIRFMVPIQIDVEITSQQFGSQSITVNGGIDLAKKELTVTDFPEEIIDALKSKVFEYLKDSTTLAEDTYQAGEEVYEQAETAAKEHDKLFENMRNF